MDYKGLFWGLLAFVAGGMIAFVLMGSLSEDPSVGTYAGGGAFTNEDGGLATTSTYTLSGMSKQVSATSSNRYHARVTIQDGDAWIRCKEDQPAAHGEGIYVSASSTTEIMDSDSICTDGIQAVGDGTDGDASAEISWYELRY